MVLIINLNTTIDKTILIDDFKTNHIFRPKKLIQVGGGKGVNVARVLNTLNVENTVIGFVGGAQTEIILNTLHKEKINFVPVPIHGYSRTCSLIIDRKNNTETIINENGPDISKLEIKNFLTMYHKVFNKKIKYLVISGSQPLSLPPDFYTQLIKYAQIKKVKIFVDTSQKPLQYSIKTKPDLIKPNHDELKSLLNLKTLNNTLMQKALIRFNKMGIKHSIITLGEKGSIYLNRKKEKIIKVIPPPIKKISTIGSGDAYMAGLVYGFINKMKIEKTLKWATALGAANALKIGAGILRKKDAELLYRKIKIS